MPPVLYIALCKLARCAHHNLRAQQVRRGPSQGHGILQLVAKTRSTTGLVKTGLGPQPASHRLVQQPAVHQGIKQRIGGLDRGSPQQMVPGAAHLRQALGRKLLRRLVSGLQGLTWRVTKADKECFFL